MSYVKTTKNILTLLLAASISSGGLAVAQTMAPSSTAHLPSGTGSESTITNNGGSTHNSAAENQSSTGNGSSEGTDNSVRHDSGVTSNPQTSGAMAQGGDSSTNTANGAVNRSSN